MEEALRAAAHFDLSGRVAQALPWGQGHIHRTFRVETDGGKEYILQKINTAVFPQPGKLMEHILRVTRHMADAAGKSVFCVSLARDGHPWWQDECGGAWRVYPLIPNTFTLQEPRTPQDMLESGRVFGRFIKDLMGIAPKTLYVSIPGFHDTPARFDALRAAVRKDPKGRAQFVTEELEYLYSCEARACRLYQQALQGQLPLRATHNDTKLNNVLFDRSSEKGVCAVDLDTVMPGLAAYDFGDAIRFGASSAPEDAQDTRAVHLDLLRYAAYARGFLQGCADALTHAELDSLAEGPFSITIEQAVRFLTDYILGDIYYRVDRPGHNLQRCRAQLALARDMEKRAARMRDVIVELTDREEN
ncbi:MULTISPECIES: aminoglycoside phosphotransferase family protein [unclassified Clostridium]|uniref:phosphotransferase enzyme family protein n=1 Tax=unclassified Clostridium TaxID=2614128 RepID=UPI00110694AE|nr:MULTISPECIES: aminoglycoside phosphotransferase family protein [unclassified Clostridium]